MALVAIHYRGFGAQRFVSLSFIYNS